jgi:hypothetical protein
MRKSLAGRRFLAANAQLPRGFRPAIVAAKVCHALARSQGRVAYDYDAPN